MESASEAQTFQYPVFKNATKQIRLLHIQPDTDESDLKCTLKVYGLSDDDDASESSEDGSANLEERTTPAYRAISFTWGGQNPSERILVNGVDVLVTKNCREALWQARLHQAGVMNHMRRWIDGDIMPIFIDAVCIDQDNNEEKGAQVQRMAKIFKYASDILICPGHDVGKSESFLKGLDVWMQFIEGLRHDQRSTIISFAHIDGPEILARFQRHRNDKTTALWFSHFWSFANHPYWTRAWVVQETAPIKQRRIMCGRRSINIDVLGGFVDICQVIGRLDKWSNYSEEDFYKSTGMSRKGFNLALRQSRLYHALLRAREAKSGTSITRKSQDNGHWRMEQLGCREPRDRVYCLLSILQWRYPTGPPRSSYEIPTIRVLLDTFGRLHESELTAPLRAVSTLITWLELDVNDLRSMLALRLGQSHSDSRMDRQSGEHRCKKDHISSKTAAPATIADFTHVFISSNKNPAIFMHDLSPQGSALPTDQKKRSWASGGTNFPEVHYRSVTGEHVWVDCEVAVPLAYGDLIAEVASVVGKSHGDPSNTLPLREAWILRKAPIDMSLDLYAAVYEIVACAQLSEILVGSLRLGVTRDGVLDTAKDSTYSVDEISALNVVRHDMDVELHLDPEDALLYVAVQSELADAAEMKKSYGTGEQQFGRARFSSFATVSREDEFDVDGVIRCVHCGKNLRPPSLLGDWHIDAS